MLRWCRGDRGSILSHGLRQRPVLYREVSKVSVGWCLVNSGLVGNWEVRERTNRSIYSDKKGKTWDRSVTSKVFLVSKFFQNRSDDRVLKTIGNLLTESDRLVIFKSDIVYWEQLGKVRRSHLAITETRKKARSLRQGEKLGSSSHYLLGNEFERSDTSASEAGWGNWELWPDTGEIRFGGRSESVLKEC